MKFLVRYTGPAALVLDKELILNTAGIRVVVNNNVRSLGSQTVHHGLVWDVTLDAADPRSALGEAERYALWAANLLCTVHGTAIADPRAHFAVDVDDGTPDRIFAQMLWDAPVLRHPRRKLNIDVFRDVFARVDKTNQDDKDLWKSIERALHYFRKSTSESDEFDAFEDACDGLQSIDAKLRKRLAAPKTFDAKCPRCKKDLRCKECDLQQVRPETFGGTVAVVEEILGIRADSRAGDDEKGPARRMVDARNDVVHSRRELDDVRGELPTHLPLARRALFAGTLVLLGYNAEEVRDMTGEALELTTQAPALAVVRLRDTSSSKLLSVDRFPRVRLEGFEVASRTDSDIHFGESGIRGVQIMISVQDFDGEWEPLEGAVIIPSAPGEVVDDISVRLTKS